MNPPPPMDVRMYHNLGLGPLPAPKIKSNEKRKKKTIVW
jgi:hypothetical protein